MLTPHTSVTDAAFVEDVQPGGSKGFRISQTRLEIPVKGAQLKHPEPDGPAGSHPNKGRRGVGEPRHR
jgi:hypothetical protein